MLTVSPTRAPGSVSTLREWRPRAYPGPLPRSISPPFSRFCVLQEERWGSLDLGRPCAAAARPLPSSRTAWLLCRIAGDPPPMPAHSSAPDWWHRSRAPSSMAPTSRMVSQSPQAPRPDAPASPPSVLPALLRLSAQGLPDPSVHARAPPPQGHHEQLTGSSPGTVRDT